MAPEREFDAIVKTHESHSTETKLSTLLYLTGWGDNAVLREWYYGLYHSLSDYSKDNLLSRQMLACSVLCRLMLDGDFLFEADDPHHPTQPYDLVPNLNLSKIWHSTIIFHKVEGAGRSADSPPKKIQQQEWLSPGHLSSKSFLEQQESLGNFTLQFCLQVMLELVGLDSLAQRVLRVPLLL